MIIATIDTDTLPKEFVMAWTGIVTPSLHQISWVTPHVSTLEPLSDGDGKPWATTDEDFEAIRCKDDLHMDAVGAECFPCVPHIWAAQFADFAARIIVMVPVSELKRVGLLD